MYQRCSDSVVDRDDNSTCNPVPRSISQFAGIDDVEGERRVGFALLADCTRQILTDVTGRTRLDAELEGRAAVRAEVVSAACLGDRFSILQPSHWKIRDIISNNFAAA